MCLAVIAEDILKKHEGCGQERVSYAWSFSLDPFVRALEVLTYYSELQACTLQRLLLPGLQVAGATLGHKGEGYWFDWRPKEQRLQADHAI